MCVWASLCVLCLRVCVCVCECIYLIFLYKLINGYFILDFSTFFTLSPNVHTRGNSLKLYKLYTHFQCRSNYFSIRTINQWNQLPDEIIRCNTLNSFKSAIDNYLMKISIYFCN